MLKNGLLNKVNWQRVFAALLLLVTCHVSAVPTDEITQMLKGQEDAWNRGDLDAYMQGYWKSEQLRFVSNGKFRFGWEDTLAAYKINYPNKEALGELKFTIKEIKMLSNYAAMVVGRWDLRRIKDAPTGVFTLLIEKIDDRWVITMDHSSD
ncbi:nuclear transport factor 2 family protein [Shewanella sp. SP1S2-4]|uniref:YybH family protein n=1 Tax=Shewanella sp. SP1S2-4 TaxID=3063537 RepID=UPI00288EF510|nr:nuclear transport factor 2 family protein [Shewanella sp. SP1S2-4]MDT3321055.1 nuclear transport factor 2 family protein [Shewanella sp. SP1S2-4]